MHCNHTLFLFLQFVEEGDNKTLSFFSRETKMAAGAAVEDDGGGCEEEEEMPLEEDVKAAPT